MTVPRRDRPDSPRCPECKSAWLTERGSASYYCNTCEEVFPRDQAVTATPAKKTKSGSGVIAGRITIGRGWWGGPTPT